MDTYQRTAVVSSCSSRAQAELQRHVLEESGIPTVIGSDDAGGLHPELVFARRSTYRLLVPEGQLEEAREVLADFEPDVDLGPTTTPGSGALGMGSRLRAWLAVLLAVIVLAAAVSTAVNVFTG